MKLYTVNVEFDYVIAVADDEDPYEVAEQCFRDAKSDQDGWNTSLTTTEMRQIPAGWDDRCLPYNGDGYKRIADYMKEKQ